MLTSDAADDRRYYLVPRRRVHLAVVWLLAAVVGGVVALWALAPVWLPSVAYALEAEAPLERADALVLRSKGSEEVVERLAARSIHAGEAATVVLLGEPFTPDVLDPAARSRRHGRLVSLGVPAGSIVEVYEGDRLDEEMVALRRTADERGWRALRFLVTTPGTRRHLLVARRVLEPAGIAVGQTTLPGPDYEPDRWWANERDRGRVIIQGLVLLYAALSPT